MKPRHIEPVSTYEDACWWLIQEWVDNFDVIKGDSGLPPEGRLVAQIFWVSEQELRRDLRRMWAETFSEPRSRAVRAFSWGRG